MRSRAQLGLFLGAWAVYVFDIVAGLLVSAVGYVVGPAVARLSASPSLGVARPALRPAVAEAPA